MENLEVVFFELYNVKKTITVNNLFN